jgi:hypothetical protein
MWGTERTYLDTRWLIYRFDMLKDDYFAAGGVFIGVSILEPIA